MTAAVLQATIERNGARRRIPVMRPSAATPLPHIPRSFFDALCANIGGTDCITSDIPIAVVDGAGKIVYNINP